MKNTIVPLLASLCFLALGALAAAAAVTPWSTSEGGKMRLAALSESDQTITAILEIVPTPGWKTYWRDPGDAGMPPDINLSDSRNLELLSVSFPPPEIGRDEGGRFVGYHGPVSLVLKMARPDPGLPSELNAAVLLGLCKDICLPFQASFSLPLGDASQPEADEFMKIQMARANLPEPQSPAFRVSDAGLSADRKTFEATITSPGEAMPEFAIAPSRGVLLGGTPDIVRSQGKTHIRYAVRRLPQPLDGASVTLLVKVGERAIETTLAIDGSSR